VVAADVESFAALQVEVAVGDWILACIFMYLEYFQNISAKFFIENQQINKSKASRHLWLG
jgi:hypothetical protein